MVQTAAIVYMRRSQAASGRIIAPPPTPPPPEPSQSLALPAPPAAAKTRVLRPPTLPPTPKTIPELRNKPGRPKNSLLRSLKAANAGLKKKLEAQIKVTSVLELAIQAMWANLDDRKQEELEWVLTAAEEALDDDGDEPALE